jgi:hypothetical protein
MRVANLGYQSNEIRENNFVMKFGEHSYEIRRAYKKITTKDIPKVIQEFKIKAIRSRAAITFHVPNYRIQF